ncbi:MAG TPA: hypothetical protein PKZ99_05230 [Azospirillaceae bacterium]|nr:hypothetical protein [Azospirillaceae bacterium]
MPEAERVFLASVNGGAKTPANPNGLNGAGTGRTFVGVVNAIAVVGNDVAAAAETVIEKAGLVATQAENVAALTNTVAEAAESAQTAAQQAQNYAAGLNMPAVTAADAGKTLVVSGDGAYEVDFPAAPAIGDVSGLAAALDGKAAANLSNITSGDFAAKAAAAGIGGALSGLHAQQGADFTLGAAHNRKLTPLSGSFTVTVPAAGTLGPGAWVLLNEGAGTVAFSGAFSKNLFPGQIMTILSDGAIIKHYILAGPAPLLALWSPTDKSAAISLSDGDTRATHTGVASWAGVRGRSPIYVGIAAEYEITFTMTAASGGYVYVGFSSGGSAFNGVFSSGIGYMAINGNKQINGAASAYGAPFVTGDAVKAVVNCLTGAVTFFKNGLSQGVAGYLPPGAWFPSVNFYDQDRAVTISGA